MEFLFKSKFSVIYLMVGSIIIVVLIFFGIFFHKSWEYHVNTYRVGISDPWPGLLEAKLNEKGVKGWELINVNTVTQGEKLLIATYFKRIKK